MVESSTVNLYVSLAGAYARRPSVLTKLNTDIDQRNDDGDCANHFADRRPILNAHVFALLQ
jgi:hypothetical protein